MASSSSGLPMEAETPSRAAISRERALTTTLGKYKPRGSCDVTKVALSDRIKQFPDQKLCIREGKLFCAACKENVSSKKSILKAHVLSKKHIIGKEKILKSKMKEQTMMEALKKGSVKSKDSTLPLASQVYRSDVVEEFLKAGIAVSKIDNLRPLLEKHGGYRLTHSSNLSEYISLVYKQEIERLKAEIKLQNGSELTRDLSVIFDGSTRQGEAIVIVVRFIDNN